MKENQSEKVSMNYKETSILDRKMRGRRAKAGRQRVKGLVKVDEGYIVAGWESELVGDGHYGEPVSNLETLSMEDKSGKKKREWEGTSFNLINEHSVLFRI